MEISKGCIICAGNLITTNIRIKDFVILNLGCTVGHDTIIKNYAAFMPSVNISGEVTIGEGVYVGTGAKIINQLEIGDYIIVGAGAVVSKTLPAKCTAVGVPAKPIKFHEQSLAYGLKSYLNNQQNMAKVKNVQGHYQVPTGYSSWLNYWERKKKMTAEVCQKNGCNEKFDLEGGHVYKVGDEETVYLVPICHEHNHYTLTDEYEVPEDMLLEVPKEDLKREILEDWLVEIIKKRQEEK